MDGGWHDAFMGLPGLGHDRTLWLDFESAGFDDETLALFAAEVDEFESVLNCRVRIGVRDRSNDASWMVAAPGSGDAPSLTWDHSTLTLTSHAAGPEQMLDSMQLLHALVRHPDSEPAFRAPASLGQ